MAPVVERVVPSIEIGEGPHWDANTQSLYYVDVFGKAIHRYVPATKKHTKAVIGTDCVSFIIPVEGQKNKYLISIGRNLAVVTWDGESDRVSNTEVIAEVHNHPDTMDNRFNDGKCDPSGRLWAGSMSSEAINGVVKGALFSLENKEIKTHLTDIGMSNGLCWSSDHKTMYYIDSLKEYVEQFDFDIKNGTICNGRVIFTPAKHGIDGVLDGMTIDTDDNLWIAIFNGYRVIQIDPRKPETLLQTVPIPAKQTTSVAFGGPNLDELYVTSGALTIGGVVLSPPDHGATFKVTGTGAKGYPGVNVKL
ncbi:regucalcin [Aethina tumida]|uniref:regucalcin n=1 Tax=Aethina tumida TaxID=116153 RepID=UPI002147B05D|nr:regucalcin [Aethina tumida]XP_049822112.1 regucalcin [Aethina tumida]